MRAKRGAVLVRPSGGEWFLVKNHRQMIIGRPVRDRLALRRKENRNEDDGDGGDLRPSPFSSSGGQDGSSAR